MSPPIMVNVPNPATRPSTPIDNSTAQTGRGLKREYAVIIPFPDRSGDQASTPRATIAISEGHTGGPIHSSDSMLTSNFAADGRSKRIEWIFQFSQLVLDVDVDDSHVTLAPQFGIPAQHINIRQFAFGGMCRMPVIIYLLTSSLLISMLDVMFDTFDPSQVPLPDYALILKMDWFVDTGITREEFSRVFIQCDECHTCLPRQNMYYHNCDQALSQHQKVLSHDGDKEYILQAQTYGLPVDRFSSLFANCRSCNKFMTREASRFHDCIIMERQYY